MCPFDHRRPPVAITLQDLINAAQSPAEGSTAADAVAALLAENATDPEVDVDALQAEAINTFNGLRESGVDSEDSIAAIEALADVVDGTRAEQGRRDTASQEHQARLDALAQRVNADATSEEGDGDADASTEEMSDSETIAETSDTGADTEATAEPQLEAVAASARRPVRKVRLSDIERKTVAMPTRNRAGAVITAAADVSGFAPGQRLSTAELAAAANTKLQAFPSGPVEGAQMRASVARINMPFSEDLVADGTNDQDVIDHAADTSRLSGGSLVAAGGWCAPSETLYELGGILADANAGLIDLPEVQAKRGGLRFTEGPDYAAIYGASDLGFIQTEAQAIAGSGFTTPTGGTVAGTEKPFYRVPCPSFTEVRAEAVGLGIKAGILQNDAYPEMTAEIVEHALIAHAHKVNTRTINRMVTESGSAITLALGPSATTAILNAVDIQLMDYRYANRMSDGAELEVKLPLWLKAVIRSDQAVRNGSTVTESYEVTDQKIEAWFKARNAVPQWLYDWQDAFSGVAGGFGAATAITSWPDTVDILIYKAGTFVRSRGEVISLDAIYDSTNIKVNDFHRLFVEEKLLVIKRRWKARLLRIALSLNGTVGASQILDADGKIAPVTP
jgi:hypothetical protein